MEHLYLSILVLHIITYYGTGILIPIWHSIEMIFDLLALSMSIFLIFEKSSIPNEYCSIRIDIKHYLLFCFT